MKLYTIGYGGLDPQTFIQILQRHGITLLLDIRELPISHKRGFSKTALAGLLESQQIHYRHLQALGCPRDIRHAYRADHDWARYAARYLDYLHGRGDDIRALAELVQTETCCLLCAEADYQTCHRKLVAEEVRRVLGEGLAVEHLTADT